MVTVPHTYELDIQKREAYVFASIRATRIDRSMALEYLGEIINMCAEEGCRRIMIERDIPAAMTDGDIFAVVKEFLPKVSGLRIALVNRHLLLHESLQFAIELSSQGGVECKYFVDTATAERWLLN